jgi:hypothetical protein
MSDKRTGPDQKNAPEQDKAPQNSQPEAVHPAGHDSKKDGRPKDDPSEAPESGDRKATGNV